jgi:hypothetical protein
MGEEEVGPALLGAAGERLQQEPAGERCLGSAEEEVRLLWWLLQDASGRTEEQQR